MPQAEGYAMRLLLLLGGLLIALPVGALVVWSILADASMLTDAMGVWGLALFFVTPALVGLYVWRQR